MEEKEKMEEKKLTLDDLRFVDPDTVSISLDEDEKVAQKVDITKLNIVERGPIETNENLEKILKGSENEFEIIATQSGYIAKVKPLTYKDTFDILNSNLDTYNQRLAIFKMVFNKITDIQIDRRIDFPTWLSITTLEDLETFYFGLYAATFPENGKLTVTCPKCSESSSYSITSRNLILTDNKKEIDKRMKDIRETGGTIEGMKKLSLLTKNEGIKLPNSGIIAEIGLPTLFEVLDFLKREETGVDDNDVETRLSIKKLLIPFADSGTYTKVTDKGEISGILDRMSLADSGELRHAVNELSEKHRIKYAIKELKCSGKECNHVMKNIPVPLQDILFTLIFERIQ